MLKNYYFVTLNLFQGPNFILLLPAAGSNALKILNQVQNDMFRVQP